MAAVDLFLESGVDIDAPHTVSATTALMKACASGSPLVPHLLAKGASVNAEDNEKNTPLLYVAARGGRCSETLAGGRGLSHHPARRAT